MESRQKQRLTMPSFSDDVVELILERLPVNSLQRFKAVSKQWRSTIQDPFFQKRHLKQSERKDPEILMVSVYSSGVVQSLRTFVLGSSSSVRILTPWENTMYFASHNSCDGLVCLYYPIRSGYIINPATRWYRPLPVSRIQEWIFELGFTVYSQLHRYIPLLGFGKDKVNGTYKAVWLYNSDLGKETVCEVFDFTTDFWRLVTPSCPYRIAGIPAPVYVDGSLHWFTMCKESKVVSLDLHTETFQVVSKAPFTNNVRPYNIVMCNLDDRLCVSEMVLPNQIIWSFDSGNKTWDKLLSINLDVTSQWLGLHPMLALSPLLLFGGDKKKKKLLLHSREMLSSLLVLDLETGSYHTTYQPDSVDTGHPVCYFPSLFSI